GEHLERFQDLELRLAVVACAFEQGRERAHVVGSEDHIDPWRLLEDDVLVFLGEASAHGDLHALVVALGARQVAERAIELVVGVLADRAGVDHHDVGFAVGLGPHIARGLERTGEALRAVHVHLAAEGAHLVGARSGLPVLRGGVEQRHGADSLRRARRAEGRYRTASGRVTCATLLATWRLLAEADGSGGPLRERLVDGRADGAARVAPASEVAAEPTYGRLAVHARQLARPLAREFARTGQLVTRVDQVEGVLDRRRRQQPPGELGSDRRAAERLAFLKRRDQVLREGGVVDEPDPREAVALARDTRLVDPAVTQQTLDLAAGVRTTPERLHRDALRVGGEVALRVAQARAAVIDLRAPRVIPLQLVGLGDIGRIVVAGGGRGRLPCAEQVADGREPAVGLIHGRSPSRVLLARG